MVTGIVLVNVERSMIQSVIKDLMELEGVSEVYTVAGEYDLVAMVRVPTNSKLSEVVVKRMTNDIKGIIHTKTLISLEAKSKVDLALVFG